MNLLEFLAAIGVLEFRDLFVERPHAHIFPSRDRIGQVIILESELRGEVGSQRLSKNAQALLFIELPQPRQRILWQDFHTAMLVERPDRDQSIPDHRAAAFARHKLGKVHAASNLRHPPAGRTHGAAKSRQIALAHHIGDHWCPVKIELYIAFLTKDLGADAAAPGFHAFGQQVAHLLQFVLGGLPLLGFVRAHHIAIDGSQRDERHDVDALWGALHAIEIFFEADPVPRHTLSHSL